MKTGDKFILINHPPYVFGIKNGNEVKTIIVEIIEERNDAKGEFTGNEGKGYLAKGSDGYTYGYNYPHINEGFSDGVWTRYIPDEEFLKLSPEDKEKLVEDYLWHDFTKYQCPAKAVFAINEDFVDYCEAHQQYFYNRKGCFYCKHMPEHRPKIIMNMEEHNWKGWY